VSRGRAEWGLIWNFDIMITYTSIVVVATYQDRGLIWSFDIMITLKEMLKKLNGYSYLKLRPVDAGCMVYKKSAYGPWRTYNWLH
jgi:hypothetical protein